MSCSRHYPERHSQCSASTVTRVHRSFPQSHCPRYGPSDWHTNEDWKCRLIWVHCPAPEWAGAEISAQPLENGQESIWKQFRKGIYTGSFLLARKKPKRTTEKITDLEYKISKEPIKELILLIMGGWKPGWMSFQFMNGLIYGRHQTIWFPCLLKSNKESRCNT